MEALTRYGIPAGKMLEYFVENLTLDVELLRANGERVMSMPRRASGLLWRWQSAARPEWMKLQAG